MSEQEQVQPGETAARFAEGEAAPDLHFFYHSSPILTGAVMLLPDGDQLHLHGNPATCRLFGLEPGGMNGRTARSLGVDEEILALWRGHFLAAERSRAPVVFDYCHARGTAAPRWLSVTVAALGEGRFGYLGAEITDRVAAEQALAASEAHFRQIFEYAAIGIAEIDLDGRWIRVNQRLCAMLGYKEEALRKLRFQDITYADDVQPDEFLLGRLVAGEIPSYTMEKRYVRADGELIWAKLTVAMVRDETGAPKHFVSVVEDISAAKDTQAKLRAAETDYRRRLEEEIAQRTAERDRLWNTARDLMVVAAPTGEFLSANPAWERVLGWTVDEVVGRFATEFMPPQDVERLAGELAGLEEGAPAPPCEHRYLHKDGSWRLISWVAERKDGLIYSIGRDVTEVSRARQALEAAEAAVHRRSKLEAIGQLTGGIAHDFNNLLAAISGAADLIRLRPDDPQRVRKLAQMAIEATERGAKLTAQLLAFSREQAVQLKPVDVSTLLAGMEQMIARSLGPSIAFDLPAAEGVWAICDATQLEMALLNLALNARDAMPDGGRFAIAARTIELAGDPELVSGRYVAIEISDTGMGMSAEVRDRAFEPFFTTKGVGKGSGLGLSQVYGMARQANGDARLTSEPGKGTNVQILIPASEAAVTFELVAPPQMAQPGEGATILVVDDDPDVPLVAVSMIESLGHNVLQAANGNSALMIVEQHRPDLILIDYAMPGMNGAELAVAIRRRIPNQPLIFVTGFSDVGAIAKAVDGAELLTKPFRIDELAAAVARMVPGGAAGEAPAGDETTTIGAGKAAD